MTVQLMTTASELASAARVGSGSRAGVMTMGALHDGHAELMRVMTAAGYEVVA